MEDIKKPWAGRFEKPTEPSVEDFTESISFDKQLYKYDIQGSIAHATMLAACGLLTEEEKEAIILGLKEIEKEIERLNLPKDFAQAMKIAAPVFKGRADGGLVAKVVRERVSNG